MVIVQNIAIISLFCVTCVDIAIPTQVIVQKTTQKGGVAGVMFIATKVMIQLNGKSGAALWMIKLLDDQWIWREPRPFFGTLKQVLRSFHYQHRPSKPTSSRPSYQFKRLQPSAQAHLILQRRGGWRGRQRVSVHSKKVKSLEANIKEIYANVGGGNDTPTLSEWWVDFLFLMQLFVYKQAHLYYNYSGYTRVPTVVQPPICDNWQ